MSCNELGWEGLSAEKTPLVVLVASSTGDGDPPDNAAKFFATMKCASAVILSVHTRLKVCRRCMCIAASANMHRLTCTDMCRLLQSLHNTQQFRILLLCLAIISATCNSAAPQHQLTSSLLLLAGDALRNRASWRASASRCWAWGTPTTRASAQCPAPSASASQNWARPHSTRQDCHCHCHCN